MPTVTMPDGQDVVFPDDMPPEQIKQLIAQKAAGVSPAMAEFAKSVNSKGVLNYIDDVARALALGATFGFADKIAAAADAAIGGGTYEENLKKQRKQSADIPAGIKIPAEIAGTVATSVAAAPVTGPIAAATGLSKLPGIARAIGTGAGIGGLQGAGQSDNVSVGDVATGAGVGGAVGGVAYPVLSGLAKVAGPVINTVRGAFNPEGEAARRVGAAVGRDYKAGDAGLTPSQYSSAASADVPVAIADMGGETTRALARSAANTSPEARATIQNFANARFEGQTDRAVKFVEGLVGSKADVGKVALNIDSAARAANGPAYKVAYEAGDKPVWSPVLERLSASPAIQSAMRGAEKKWGDWAVIDGFGAMNPPARVANGGILSFGGGGLKTFPNIQYWDYVARDLAGKAQAAREAGNMQEAARFGGLEKLLKTELDSVVPEFGAARKGAAGFFGADNALEAGQKFISSSIDINDARRALAKMSDGERDLFKFGFVGALVDKIATVPDRADIVKRIGASPDARQRFALALGDNEAKKLSAFLDVESVLGKLKDAVTGNSTTARQLAELGLAGGTLGYGEITNDPMAMTKAALVYGLLRGQRAVDSRVVNKVADLLVSKDPAQLLKGVEMVAKSKALGNSLRNMFTVAASQQAAENITPTSMPQFGIPALAP